MAEDQEDREDRENKEQKGFTVHDRRGFEPDGTVRDQSEPAGWQAASDQSQKLPEIDFSTLLLSLSTSAMVHLGEAPNPDGSRPTDLVLAKQTIDIISMLKEKTTGNLTAEEERLLAELLYDLRLRYVAAARA